MVGQKVFVRLEFTLDEPSGWEILTGLIGDQIKGRKSIPNMLSAADKRL
jgi:hypothetical protein